jgi:hypothetical protein
MKPIDVQGIPKMVFSLITNLQSSLVRSSLKYYFKASIESLVRIDTISFE